MAPSIVFVYAHWREAPSAPPLGELLSVSEAEGVSSVEWYISVSLLPLGFPRGEAGRLDGSSEPARLTDEGQR